MRAPLALAALALALLLPAAAGAAGATQVVDQTDCASYLQYDFSTDPPTLFTATACLHVDGVMHDTTTPNGRTVHVFEGTETSTYYRDGVLVPAVTVTYAGHYVVIGDQGVQEVVIALSTYTFTYNGQACTSTGALHYAHGAIQFNQTTLTCS